MTLADAIANYVDLKQSMGMRFRSERCILKALHRHVGEVDLAAVTPDAVATFLAGRGPITATWLNKHRTLRRFYHHWITRGRIIGSPVPTAVPRVAQNFVPHVYSNDELRRLLAAVDEHQARRGCQIAAHTFRVERNFAENTRRSYRDTLALAIPFVATAAGTSVDRVVVSDVAADRIRQFLGHLEQARSCRITTRNQRLAALHSLARFIGGRSPEHLAWCSEVCSIPFKKAPHEGVCYLEKPEMEALLDAPDRRTRQGFRDHTVLLFLYNSGARASEAAGVTVGDLDLPDAHQASVRLMGKGSKVRRCPLWPSTATALKALISNRPDHAPVFVNRRAHAMTRFGVHDLVARHARQAASRLPSLQRKRVSPDTIRHTTATHLLRAGVDINTIRAWLGHVSIETTNIYAEIDLASKAKALATCTVQPDGGDQPIWTDNKDLLVFLRSL